MITRHFVTVGSRQVHYRRAGSGPPVFLLHASPGSSASMTAMINRLAGEFTVIAPDTPGNGQSEPLPLADPIMADYADALAELMTALDIPRAGIYGSYTGAGCALEMARRHPDRVSVSIVNGYLQFTEAERAEILAHYLPKLELDWYGGHLIWAWARIREQVIFFPWFHKDDPSRMMVDQPSPAAMHAGVLDLLRSGENYRKPYRSAFMLDYGRAVLEAKARTVITTSQQDVMWPQWTRMPPPPANVTAAGTANRDESWTIALTALRAHPSSRTTPPAKATAPLPGRVWSQFLQIDGGNLLVRRTSGKGRPILFVHASGESSLAADAYMKAFAAKRPTLAVDMPGHGESDAVQGAGIVADVRALRAVLAALKIGAVDVVGMGDGAATAVELAMQTPDMVRTLVLPQVAAPNAAEQALRAKHPPPDMTPRAHGAHFLAAWNYARDRELFEPWDVQTAAHAIRGRNAQLDPATLQRRTLDLIKAKDSLVAAWAERLGYPMLSKLSQLKGAVVLGSPGSPDTTRAQQALAGAAVVVRELGHREPIAFAAMADPLLGAPG